MNDKQYGNVDIDRVERVLCAVEDKPYDFLGNTRGSQGTRIQAFFPDACDVYVVSGNKETKMEQVDKTGFFSLFTKRVISQYRYRVVYKDSELIAEDPYRFACTISEEDLTLFAKGIHYEIYRVLGAQQMVQDGVSGVRFAVWAPDARSVSVVGDFNLWDGRRHPMQRHDGYGVFEVFLPGVTVGDRYKYEIKTRNGVPILKADPYARQAEKRPNTASVVADCESFRFTDAEYLEKRQNRRFREEAIAVYELHLGSFKKPSEEDGSFYNYRELAEMVGDYVVSMGYTHIELMPVMEHPFDGSWGYQVTGYYAPTSRYGSAADFQYFVNYMHERGIGVILDWVPAHFPKDAFGLAKFDGSCVYEHFDERQGCHPHWGTLIFNYGRNEVKNFLIANALYWAEVFHADGIRIDAVASMLYLDYGKEYGEWVANAYGGRENLDAIELFKHLNSIMKKRNPGVLMIAEESTAWPSVTRSVDEGGLGFDFKWNMGWMNDFSLYMKTDPLFRKFNQGALTFSMVYAYSEAFMLEFSHDEVVHLKGSMIQKMPGSYDEKFANLRAAYAYMITHPGKKLLFMGQEFAQFTEWNEAKSLDWLLVDEFDSHRRMQQYTRDLNRFYRSHPALFRWDCRPEGFSWVDFLDADHSIISFLRYDGESGEQLLVICNFTPEWHDNYRVGVPLAGVYTEVFHSEAPIYGGHGEKEPCVLDSEPVNWNNRDNSIQVNLRGLAVVIFACPKGE